jgi:hypothetical protein
MDNKAAIKIAKAYVADIFADERVQDIALEEINRDERSIWEITIGFSRPILSARSTSLIEGMMDESLKALQSGPLRRSYKRVKIRDDNGEVVGLSEAEWAQ